MVYPRIAFKASLHSSVCWGSYLRSTGSSANGIKYRSGCLKGSPHDRKFL